MRVKVSEKNAASVMGKINIFFRKEVKEDIGLKMVQVGSEDIFGERGRLLWKKPIWEEKNVFQSYTGRCYVHALREKYLEKMKNGERVSNYDKTDCLLAISTPYNTDCIPISIGDVIELKGNQLVIKHSYLKGLYSTRKFIQLASTKEEKVDELKRGLFNHLTWFCDDSMWYDIAADEFEGMMIDVNCVNREIQHAFAHFIDEIDLSQASGTFRKTISMKDIAEDYYVRNDDFNFDIVVNLDAVDKNSNEVFNIILDGKSVDSFGVICKAFERDNNDESDDESANCDFYEYYGGYGDYDY